MVQMIPHANHFQRHGVIDVVRLCAKVRIAIVRERFSWVVGHQVEVAIA